MCAHAHVPAGVVQLNSPTQVEVFSNATTVITFEVRKREREREG